MMIQSKPIYSAGDDNNNAVVSTEYQLRGVTLYVPSFREILDFWFALYTA